MLSILIWAIVIGSSIWVLIDAKKIGVKKGQIKGICNMGAVAWFIVCLLLWIIAFPCYLWKRRKYMEINGKASSSKAPAVVGIVLIAVVILSIVGSVLVNSYNAYLDKANALSQNQASILDQIGGPASAAKVEAAAPCPKDSDYCSHNVDNTPVPGVTPVAHANASTSPQDQPDVTADSGAASAAGTTVSSNGTTSVSASPLPSPNRSASDTATATAAVTSANAASTSVVANTTSIQVALSELHSTDIGRMLDLVKENNWAGLDQLAASLAQSTQVAPGDPDAAKAANANGLAALRQGDVKDALGSFDQAIQADPSDVEAINNDGYALIKAGQNGLAVKALGNALKLAPIRTDAWANLSEAIAGSDPDQAVSALRLAYYFSSNRDHTVKYLQNVASYNQDSAYQHVAAVALNQLAAVPTSNAAGLQSSRNSAVRSMAPVSSPAVQTRPEHHAAPAPATPSPTMAAAQQSAQTPAQSTPDALYNSEAHSQCAGGLFGKACRHKIRERVCAGVAPGNPGATVCNKG